MEEEDNSEEIEKLFNKVDKREIDFIVTATEELLMYQPLMLALVGGYYEELEIEDSDDILFSMFIIWEYYKDRESASKIMISNEQFEKHLDKNHAMFSYLEGEPNQTEMYKTFEIVMDDFEQIDLLIALTERVKYGSKYLSGLDHSKFIFLVVGLKSIIDCFEENDKIEPDNTFNIDPLNPLF